MYHKDFYINRLVSEWLTHNSLIIGCDIDDTIIPYNVSQKEDCENTVDLIKDCMQEGVYLVINTARGLDRHISTMEEVKKLGLHPICVNENPSFLNLPYGNSGKIYANIFLDDRGGLSLAKYQLREALEIVKQIREQQKLMENART